MKANTLFQKSRVLLFIFVIALLFRLLALAFLPERGIAGDSISYHDLASRISQGKGYTRTDSPDLPDNRRLPGYPLFLAFVYFFFGQNLLIVKIFQIIIDSFLCILVYALGNQLFNSKVALWSALLVAIYPPYIIFSNFVLSETIYVFLVTATMYFLVKAFKYQSALWFMLGGILFGLGILVRSTLILFPVLLFISSYFLMKAPKKKIIMFFIIFCLAFLATLSPWIIRNYLAFNKFQISHAGFGWALWVGTLDLKNQNYPHWDQEPVKSLIKDAETLEEIDAIFMPKAIENLRDAPLSYIGLSMRKFVKFWLIPYGTDIFSKQNRYLSLIYRGGYYLVFLLFLWGILKVKKNRVEIMMVMLLMLYFSIFHSMLIMVPRYALPITTFVFIFSACGFFNIKHKFVKAR